MTNQPPAVPPPGYPAAGYAVAGAKPPVKGWDVAVTVILLVIDAALAFAASVMGMFLIMASDPCGVRDCGNDLIVLGWIIGMVLPWLVLIATGIIAIVRLVRRKLAFWVALLGALGIALALLIAFMVTAAGVPSS